MDQSFDEAASFEELAAIVEKRAERARGHAARARQEAAGDRDDSRARELQLVEARVHAQSAELLTQTAHLYRNRARDLRAIHSDRHQAPSG